MGNISANLTVKLKKNYSKTTFEQFNFQMLTNFSTENFQRKTIRLVRRMNYRNLISSNFDKSKNAIKH